MVKFQVVYCSTISALATIPLPDSPADFPGNMAVRCSCGSAHQGLAVELNQCFKPLSKKRGCFKAMETDRWLVFNRHIQKLAFVIPANNRSVRDA